MKNISEIIESVRVLKGYKTEGDVAKALGMGLSALSNHKKNGTIPYKNILSFSENNGISFDLILTGEGTMARGAADRVAEEARDYSPRPGGGAEEVKPPEQHSDKGGYSLLAGGGTGMLTIGDVVQYIQENGDAEEREEMMFKKLEFIETAKALAFRIRNRKLAAQQKKASA